LSRPKPKLRVVVPIEEEEEESMFQKHVKYRFNEYSYINIFVFLEV
jgi:hypothetical protein